MSQPRVTVIVPTYERCETLKSTLTALRDLDYPSELLETIVVDDGSKDETEQTVRAFPGVIYMHQSNRGVASARNAGARAARGDVLLFVDDDIVLARDNVRRHLAIHQDYGECIVAGHSAFSPEIEDKLRSSPFGRFRLWAERVWKQEYADRWGSQGRIHPPAVPTQNLSIRRDLFWRLDGFDERFPVGGEDQDLCWRARAVGCALIYDYGIRVIHNDQHRDLMALCRREERGAIGLVCLVRKHPDFPRPAALELNGPLRRRDSVPAAIRKLSRSALSAAPALWVAHRVIRAAEKLRPHGGDGLDLLYRSITGLYVFRGIRRGYRLTSGRAWEAVDRARPRGHPRGHSPTDA